MADNVDPSAETPPADHRRGGTRRGHVIRLVVVTILVGGLGGGLWYFNEFRKQAIAQFFASNVPPPTAVATTKAEAGPMPQYLDGIGTVVAIRQVDVSPEVAGRVVGIMFEPGSDVVEGQPLVQLNDAQEQADRANYQAQARVAEANLQRSRALATHDFTSKASLDQNQALLDQARANITRTEAMIAQKLVAAPFAGRLGIRNVELGQYVSPGTELVTLTDLDTLHVNFTVPEQASGQVKPGQKVEITTDAYPDRIFEAELTTIEPQIDPDTRTIQLQATLDNPDHRLLPGMFANTRLVLPPQPEMITLPETAVSYSIYGESVFVVQQDGTGEDGEPKQKAVQTAVRTGPAVDGRVAILEGLKAGDLVVSSGSLKLQNGAPVRVVTDTALQTPATPPLE